jgi:hypothetical protein
MALSHDILPPTGNERGGMMSPEEAHSLTLQLVSGALPVLQLRGRALGRDAARGLLSALAECGPHAPCRTLDLGATSLHGLPWSTSEGGAISALVGWLSPGESLQVLCFAGNLMGDQGCEVLARALVGGGGGVPATQQRGVQQSRRRRLCPGLRELDLDRNNIRDRGAAAVATLITHAHGCLTKLSLANNEIGNSGAVELARALDRTSAGGSASRLRSLSVAGNLIGSKGISELQRSAGGWLNQLALERNLVSVQAVARLAARSLPTMSTPMQAPGGGGGGGRGSSSRVPSPPASVGGEGPAETLMMDNDDEERHEEEDPLARYTVSASASSPLLAVAAAGDSGASAEVRTLREPVAQGGGAHQQPFSPQSARGRHDGGREADGAASSSGRMQMPRSSPMSPGIISLGGWHQQRGVHGADVGGGDEDGRRPWEVAEERVGGASGAGSGGRLQLRQQQHMLDQVESVVLQQKAALGERELELAQREHSIGVA